MELLQSYSLITAILIWFLTLKLLNLKFTIFKAWKLHSTKIIKGFTYIYNHKE